MNHRSKVTIEDLLKLKRTERPAPEFWHKFEQELRQKQLTALMEKRSWWQELPHLLSARAYLPLGTTAVVAFTLVAVKYGAAPAEMASVAAVSAPVVAAPASFAPPAAAAVPVSSPLVNRKDHTSLAVDDRVAITTRSLPAAAIEAEEPAAVTAESRETLSPSARSIAANLAQLEQSEPELVHAVLGSRLSAPERTPANTGAAVEFASLSSSGSKRSRLLAQYNEHQAGPISATSEVLRERLSRRLADADYNDRFSRVGVKGDQVSLRF